jgi:hypothetical protein
MPFENQTANGTNHLKTTEFKNFRKSGVQYSDVNCTFLCWPRITKPAFYWNLNTLTIWKLDKSDFHIVQNGWNPTFGCQTGILMVQPFENWTKKVCSSNIVFYLGFSDLNCTRIGPGLVQDLNAVVIQIFETLDNWTFSVPVIKCTVPSFDSSLVIE